MKIAPALVLAACALSAAAAQAQTMFRGDAAHTGVYRDAAPRTLKGVKWTFPTGGRIVSSPVHDRGTLYFGSDDGHLYAVVAADGRQRWRRRTNGPVSSTPAVSGGIVHFASYDGKLYALDASTGAQRWFFATGGERRFEAKGLHGLLPKNQTIADPFDVFLSSPVVAEGIVYFGSGDGHVYALDAATGALRWKYLTGDVVHASPAYANGVVYVGSWDSYLYALDAKSGTLRWRFQGGTDPVIHNQVGFQSSPAIAEGVVYVGSRDSNLYALDAASGVEKWRFNNDGSWVITSPAIVDGKVIFATSDTSRYYVVDAKSGRALVEQQGQAFVFASPAVAGSVVLVGVLNGTLEARDVADGALLWAFRTEASKRNDGWTLTADGAFNMPMLYPSNWGEAPIAATVRQFGVGSIFSSPLVVAGVVYFGSSDGTLYALE